jgi:mannose-6-phosphate isomerase-like protein (cupin superfamily)
MNASLDKTHSSEEFWLMLSGAMKRKSEETLKFTK